MANIFDPIVDMQYIQNLLLIVDGLDLQGMNV